MSKVCYQGSIKPCNQFPRWLYTLFLAQDANFKQKSRLRSGKRDEVALGPGWGTFVLNKPYLEYVSQFANQEEVRSILFMSVSIDCDAYHQVSHCVGFSAMSAANRNRTGLRATGIGAVSCARNEMYRPNGMGDLQFGERYANSMSVFHIDIVYPDLLTWTS